MSAPKLAVGNHLSGHYVIEAVVGQGAMSCVYRARDLDTPSIVWAIKEMRSDGIPEEDRASAVALFEQEATLLAQMSHTGLPKVVDFFSDGTCHYLVMELIYGLTLEHIVERHGRYREADFLPIAFQLASCLKYLHGQPSGPIIFRDLKPSNIMIEVDPAARTPWPFNGHVKLVDFGVARMFKPGQKRDTQPLGTPGFAAPEQYGAHQTTPRTDLFSLGATIHYALTGLDPDPAASRFPPLRQAAPGSSEAMEELLIALLQPDPAHRPASADEVLEALERIRQQTVLSPHSRQVDVTVPTRIDLEYLVQWFRRTFSLREVTPVRPGAWIAIWFAGMLVAAILVPSFVRSQAQGHLSACESNEKYIATALEIYSTDNSGHYPPGLALLTPTYLSVVPTCPSARRDTYSAAYTSKSNPDGCTFYCLGNNHRDAGDSENFPAYSSGQGFLVK